MECIRARIHALLSQRRYITRGFRKGSQSPFEIVEPISRPLCKYHRHDRFNTVKKILLGPLLSIRQSHVTRQFRAMKPSERYRCLAIEHGSVEKLARFSSKRKRVTLRIHVTFEHV